MDCPICMEVMLTTKNCITTECGHQFHASCLMKNTAVNGYDCPCCRTQMAETADDDEEDNDSEDGSEYETDDEEDAEEEEEFALMGFRWFFQRIHDEELEGDATEYEDFQKEEKEWLDDSDKASEEANDKIENMLRGLKHLNTISYEELLKAFVHSNLSKFSLSNEAEDAFHKVNSTLNSISERTWT
jgi:hypothetical protein